MKIAGQLARSGIGDSDTSTIPAKHAPATPPPSTPARSSTALSIAFQDGMQQRREQHNSKGECAHLPCSARMAVSTMLSARSRSSRAMVSGGDKRQHAARADLEAQTRLKTAIIDAFRAFAGLGFRLSRSSTISTPNISPRPRTSPTNGLRRPKARSRSSA